VAAVGQKGYRGTNSYPRLSITAVSIPADKSKPLKITVILQCVGRTPIALSRDQFSVHISARNDPLIFLSDAIFPANAAKTFILAPNEHLTLNIEAFKDRFDRNKRWSKLPRGKYTLKVYINSSKTPDFDYQWLGQTYSNGYILEIK
jgi:hypothetical protein